MSDDDEDVPEDYDRHDAAYDDAQEWANARAQELSPDEEHPFRTPRPVAEALQRAEGQLALRRFASATTPEAPRWPSRGSRTM